MTSRNGKTFNIAAVIAAFSVLMIFAAVATAATISDDDTGHFLRGTNAPDTINANGGDDRVDARKGADTVDAGTGNDVVYAGKGSDTVNGGEGNDVLRGNLGDDAQHGGAGDDIIFAGPGRDESWGDDGNDKLWALARSDVHGRYDVNGDTLHGGNGDDIFRTRDGEVDLIDCGPGNDTAYLDWKDKILDATKADPNGSCEVVKRHKRASRDHQEVVK